LDLPPTLDRRVEISRALADALMGNGFAAPVSRLWKGYWQRAA
jgi:hypothetical protein